MSPKIKQFFNYLLLLRLQFFIVSNYFVIYSKPDVQLREDLSKQFVQHLDVSLIGFVCEFKVENDKWTLPVCKIPWASNFLIYLFYSFLLWLLIIIKRSYTNSYVTNSTIAAHFTNCPFVVHEHVLAIQMSRHSN